MQGVFPYLVLVGAIIALGAMALSRRRAPSVEQVLGRCSNCETSKSLRLLPHLDGPRNRFGLVMSSVGVRANQIRWV
jgi:hypothetical protein